VTATSGFRLVAAMNPFDAVGTARISAAVYDRVCRVSMGYQVSAEEKEIVERKLTRGNLDAVWIDGVVEVVRRTRTHPDLRVGSSVRGAVDTALVAQSLAELRGQVASQPSVSLDAALVALSGRVRVREGCNRTSEDIVTEIWQDVFGRADGENTAGKVGAPSGATNSL